MPDQKRHEDQQREHRMPSHDVGQQNIASRERDSSHGGARFDQDRTDRDRQNQNREPRGAPHKQDMSGQSQR
jgi:hypothetical protein